MEEGARAARDEGARRSSSGAGQLKSSDVHHSTPQLQHASRRPASAARIQTKRLIRRTWV